MQLLGLRLIGMLIEQQLRTRSARSMPIFMVAVDEAHVPHAPYSHTCQVIS
jgi:hypothetical protein